MSASVASSTERRDEARISGHSLGRMEAPKAVFPQAGVVDIEEVSACGLRLRSNAQLHPDEELVIHLSSDPQPIHATVIWVREAPPSFFGGPKSWQAGCRLEPESMTRVRLAPEVTGGRGISGRKVLWMIAAMLGAAATVAYLLLRFASIVGSAGGLH